MRKDIQIQLVEAPGKRGQLTAFRIIYSAPTPMLAQQVATQLTSLFIDENIQEQSQRAENTTDFLSSELNSARASLAEQEAKVKQFKSHYLGELPSQMDGNVHILAGLAGALSQLFPDAESGARATPLHGVAVKPVSRGSKRRRNGRQYTAVHRARFGEDEGRFGGRADTLYGRSILT